jgi:hypothetical protein
MSEVDLPKERKPSSGGRGAIIGLFAGLLFGYPVSYFFQPGALRAKFSMADYIQHIGDIMSHQPKPGDFFGDLADTAIVTWVACVILFMFAGVFLEKILETVSKPHNRV